MTPRISYWRIDGRIEHYETEALAKAALTKGMNLGGELVRAYTEWHRVVATTSSTGGISSQTKKTWPL